MFLRRGRATSSDIASRQRLRTASRRQLDVPRHYWSKFGRRAFSIAGLVVWNSLPGHPRDPSLSSDSFKTALKTPLRGLPMTLLSAPQRRNRKKESCSVTFFVSMVRVWAHREVAGPLAVLADEMVSDRRRRVITGHGYRQMSLAAYDDAAAQLQVGAADRCKV